MLLKYRDQDDYCVACKEVDIDTKTATTTQGAERLLHAIMLLLFFNPPSAVCLVGVLFSFLLLKLMYKDFFIELQTFYSKCNCCFNCDSLELKTKAYSIHL